MSDKPSVREPASWKRFWPVAALLIVAGVVGAIMTIGEGASSLLAWIDRRQNPGREVEQQLEAVSLGQSRASVENLLGPAYSQDDLSLSDPPMEDVLFRIGENWLQAVFLDDEVVMYTVQACDPQAKPVFESVDGDEIRLNVTTFAELSQAPLAPSYNFPATSPPTILEGEATTDSTSSNAQGNQLDAWGFGGACFRGDWVAGFPVVGLLNDVETDLSDPETLAELEAARSTFPVDTYTRRTTLVDTYYIQVRPAGNSTLLYQD